MRVAQPSFAAGGHDQPIAVGHQIAEKIASVIPVDDGSLGHRDDEIVAAAAVAVVAIAAGAVGRPKPLVEMKADEGRVVVGGFQDDVASPTTVTAVGAALGHVGLVTQMPRAIAAAPGGDNYPGGVIKALHQRLFYEFIVWCGQGGEGKLFQRTLAGGRRLEY